jgi:protein-tyrosine phosphatase
MGNICRSPAAEIIFRHLTTTEDNPARFEIDSAGTIGYHEGSPPDPRMTEALSQRGLAVTGRARRIHPDDLARFDHIITMDESNFEEVRSLDPEGRFHHKIRPLVSFCSEHDMPRVPDPYYGGQRGFELVIDLLHDGCRGLLREINASPTGGHEIS